MLAYKKNQELGTEDLIIWKQIEVQKTHDIKQGAKYNSSAKVKQQCTKSNAYNIKPNE